MTLFIVQFVLPTLLGYTLYAAIADRLSLGRPERIEERPRWLLGAGVALSVAAVTITALHLVYGLSLEAGSRVLSPAGLALATGLTLSLCATSWYRRRLKDDARMLADDSWASVAERCDLAADQLESDVEVIADPDSSVALSVEEDDSEPTSDAQTRLERELETERATREQVESHLRITRKALYVLESEVQDSSRQVEERAELEARVEEEIRERAAAEARAERESFARIASQTTLVEQGQDLARAQRDVRRHLEARARALSAANKSLAHARLSARARKRLEADLAEARETIENRQATISSLIRALEKEKRRTREDVASQAKQLVLHERQLKARRSLEEVARSVEGKLSSRLVKKVAKARPLISGS